LSPGTCREGDEVKRVEGHKEWKSAYGEEKKPEASKLAMNGRVHENHVIWSIHPIGIENAEIDEIGRGRLSGVVDDGNVCPASEHGPGDGGPEAFLMTKRGVSWFSVEERMERNQEWGLLL
jgi:hypothetical protein